MEKNVEEAWGILSDLIEVRGHVSKCEIACISKSERIKISDAIHSVTFSDTIILFTKTCTDAELRVLIVVLSQIFHQALRRCVPLRIGLAVGKFLFNPDKSMYAGPALIEAYRVGESAKWLGITLADSVQERARKLEMKTANKKEGIVRWPVPVENGVEHRYVVNWPAAISPLSPLSLPDFYNPFKNTFGPFDQLPVKVQEKYRNTVDFINQNIQTPVC